MRGTKAVFKNAAIQPVGWRAMLGGFEALAKLLHSLLASLQSTPG
jgi:hypothetical protein